LRRRDAACRHRRGRSARSLAEYHTRPHRAHPGCRNMATTPARKCFTIARIDAGKCGLSRVRLGKRMCLIARAKSQKFAMWLLRARLIPPIGGGQHDTRLQRPRCASGSWSDNTLADESACPRIPDIIGSRSKTSRRLIESGWRGSRFGRSLRRAAGEFEPSISRSQHVPL
jgi:hypothetical protein